jgi:hypothetical protein
MEVGRGELRRCLEECQAFKKLHGFQLPSRLPPDLQNSLELPSKIPSSQNRFKFPLSTKACPQQNHQHGTNGSIRQQPIPSPPFSLIPFPTPTFSLSSGHQHSEKNCIRVKLKREKTEKQK